MFKMCIVGLCNKCILFCRYYYVYFTDICYVHCYGDEDELQDYYFTYCNSCDYEGGAVAITCSKSCTD